MWDVCGDLTFEYLTKLGVQTKLTNFGTIVVMACGEKAKYDNIEKYNMIHRHIQSIFAFLGGK